MGEGAAPRYAGYVAWRGLEDETTLPSDRLDALEGRFTFFTTRGMQILCYFVPGAKGDTTPGHRRVNWVRYVNTLATDLARLMTGASGTHFRSFLPPGDVAEAVEREVLALAQMALPTPFRDLVEASDLFLQTVQDVEPVPRVHSRAVLIGDAAGTVRPHTASGTSKAFGDAALLAETLEGWKTRSRFPLEKHSDWERAGFQSLVNIARQGKGLAAASWLGSIQASTQMGH